jgi:hypothetical protein
MPIVSLCSARSALWVVVLGPLLSACFDVEQVDVHGIGAKPPPRLIDDFNDDLDNTIRQPADASFEPWRCFGRNGSVQLVRCDPGRGIDGPGRALTFDLLDFADGKRDYQSAELQTRAREAVDFSAYERFTFSASLEPHAIAAPGRTAVTVELYCSALGNGLVDEAWVETEVLWVEPNTNWYTYAPLMTSFEQQPWQKEQWQKANRPLLDEPSCLKQVDAVGFDVTPLLPDGKRSAGTLTVDEVYVQ